MPDENGVWRTIGGRRVFIRDGQSLSDAMKESGKFPNRATRESGTRIGHVDEDEIYDSLPESERDSMIASIRYYTDDYVSILEDEDEIGLLNRAIDAAEDVHWNEGELFRGLSVDDDFVDSLRVGDVIETGLPSSWSSDGTVAATFATGEHLSDTGQTRVILVDKTEGSRNAISIKDFSRYQDEEEVLYSGKSSFRVLDFYEEGEGDQTFVMIAVEEVRG